MKFHDLNRALQLALEVEGLVILRQTRDENVPEEIERLLADKTRELADIFGVDEVSTVASVEFEQYEDAAVSVGETPADNTMMTPAMPSAPDSAASDNTVADALCHATAESHRLEDRIAEKNARELRRALTLNDRYRFSRELFGSSNDSLNSALDTISDFTSYSDAEQWMVSILGFDPENDIVKEFMVIVAKHFS